MSVILFNIVSYFIYEYIVISTIKYIELFGTTDNKDMNYLVSHNKKYIKCYY